MSTEACNLALKNTLNEIRNVCPDISHAMVFRENGEILVEEFMQPMGLTQAAGTLTEKEQSDLALLKKSQHHGHAKAKTDS